jgi:hypothetical protein
MSETSTGSNARRARMQSRLDRYNPHLAFHLVRSCVDLQAAIDAAANRDKSETVDHIQLPRTS